jgi:hypothetical protein
VKLTVLAPLLANAPQLRAATTYPKPSIEVEYPKPSIEVNYTKPSSEISHPNPPITYPKPSIEYPAIARSNEAEFLSQEVAAPRIVGGTPSKQHGFFVEGQWGCGGRWSLPTWFLPPRAVPRTSQSTPFPRWKHQIVYFDERCTGSHNHERSGPPPSVEQQHDVIAGKDPASDGSWSDANRIKSPQRKPSQQPNPNCHRVGATSEGGPGSSDLLTLDLDAMKFEYASRGSRACTTPA